MSFSAWRDAGFGAEVVPIIPPDAKLSAASTIDPEHRGKAVGRLNGSAWSGLPNWQTREITERDLEAWQRSGAGIGLRTARFPVVDIDILAPEVAELIEEITIRELGPAPIRVGQAPKRALLYRLIGEPFSKRAVEFDDGEVNGKVKGKVEILGAGQQCVVEGEHPVTHQPYTWGCCPTETGAAALTAVDQAMVDRFVHVLSDALEERDWSTRRGAGGAGADRASVDQEGLRGDLEQVAAAVALIPNTEDTSRDEYVRIGHAIKAASAADPERGLEIYMEWAARWPGGNDPEEVRHRWGGFDAPFEIGADWLYKLAQAYGFNRGGAVFEALEPEPAPEAKPKAALIRPIVFVGRPDAEPPPREFLMKGWLPCRTLSSLYGPPGIGKSLLAQLLGTAIATFTAEVFGIEVERAPVLGLFSEDDNVELERRQWRINQALGLCNADLGDLHIEGRAGLINSLVTFPSGAPRVEPLAEVIVTKAKEVSAKLIILDNRAQMILGDENDRVVATYGGNLCAWIGRQADAAVLLVGHPSRAAGSEYSGSSAWDAVTRSRWYLTRAEPDDGEGQLTLTLAKSNYAPPGRALALAWKGGVLQLASSAMTEEELARAADLRVEAKRVFLDCLDRLTAQGRAVSHSSRAGNYAPKVMAEMVGLPADASAMTEETLFAEGAAGFSAGALAKAMEALFAEGVITAKAPVGKDANRHTRYGIARVTSEDA